MKQVFADGVTQEIYLKKHAKETWKDLQQLRWLLLQVRKGIRQGQSGGFNFI